ncbi:MAG: HIRAN domain-containing protein [Erysipelotrichaceae bacterium]|nr:HIRAN domain-containing protein [Erysipelotrichaceae bacterium]
MEDKGIYITINHLNLFDSVSFLKPGDRLILKKDRNNVYDDEAIIAYKDQMKCGYVANSVHSVVRGTFSAGRVYDQIKDDAECIIRFMNQEMLIAKIVG